MRTPYWLATVLIVGLVGNAVTAKQPQTPAVPVSKTAPSPTAVRRAAPGRQVAVLASIKELMQGIVDPSADVLFDAVFYDVTAAGIVEKMPKTDADWKEVRRNALLLAEVTNLLRMPGRRVAPAVPIPGLQNEPPGPEDLTPAQIQVLIDKDRGAFNRLAQGLADAAQLALKAADARSVDDLFASGENIDQACESCHLKYWYPKGKQPTTDELSRRKK